MMKYTSITQKRLDKQIMRISERSDILRFLDPKNKFEELEIFIKAKGKYNPQFYYDDKHISILEEALIYIRKLKKKSESLRIKNILTKLMIEKCEEVENKFLLLQAYHKQDREKIQLYNEILFGKLKNHELQNIDFATLEAKYQLYQTIILSPLGLQNHTTLIIKQVKALVEHHLQSIGRNNYHISFGKFGTTNMQVRIGPKPVIYINKKSDYNSFDVCVSILHEIYGHLLRYRKGIDSGIHILQGGTAHYLGTEEGIAVFQAARIEGLEITGKRLLESYEHIIAAEKYNRVELVEYYQMLGRRNLEAIFRSILRLKRGLEDTSIGGTGSVFYKDKVYADGYIELLKYLCNMKEKVKGSEFIFDLGLYSGRIKIPDLGCLH